jgi:phage host-nuclease inhibitor protein Gam
MKRYKISKENLNEFWGMFGKPKPQSIQQIIDNDPILKKLDGEMGDIAREYIPRIRKIKKDQPELFKKMQDKGIIDRDFK